MADSPSAHTEAGAWAGGAIDRTSPTPFYHQLRQTLEREIGAGRLRPGDRLPTENELCTRFAVSRSTVRQALTAMERDGVVLRQKGQGTFVAEARPHTWLLQSSDGVLRQDNQRSDHHVSTRVLGLHVRRLPLWACEALELAPDADGVAVERLRSIDGQPALYVVTHLPISAAGAVLAADLETESLYELLQRTLGLEVFAAGRALEAVEATGRLARLLGMSAGDPLAFVESVSWDRSRRPFECYRAWLRTDRMPIEIGVGTTAAMTGGAPDAHR